MTRALLPVLALAGLLAAIGAHAEDKPPCQSFDWSLAREAGWFAATPPGAATAGTLPSREGAARVSLSPSDGVAFAAPPERAPAAGTFSAVLTLPGGGAGRYQVTLSGEAWIDVVQPAGTRLKSVAFSGRKGCPGLRKSVRFDVGADPATLQISGSTEPTVDVAVAPAN